MRFFTPEKLEQLTCADGLSQIEVSVCSGPQVGSSVSLSAADMAMLEHSGTLAKEVTRRRGSPGANPAGLFYRQGALPAEQLPGNQSPAGGCH